MGRRPGPFNGPRRHRQGVSAWLVATTKAWARSNLQGTTHDVDRFRAFIATLGDAGPAGEWGSSSGRGVMPRSVGVNHPPLRRPTTSTWAYGPPLLGERRQIDIRRGWLRSRAAASSIIRATRLRSWSCGDFRVASFVEFESLFVRRRRGRVVRAASRVGPSLRYPRGMPRGPRRARARRTRRPHTESELSKNGVLRLPHGPRRGGGDSMFPMKISDPRRRGHPDPAIDQIGLVCFDGID